MLKVLLKKQLMQAFSWLFKNKNQKAQNGFGKLAVTCLIAFLLLFSVGALFFELGNSICTPLSEAGIGWLFVLIISMLALIVGIIGSVFNTYTTLYNAKDNDVMLSLPIKPHIILISRLISVYLTGFIFQLIISLPGIVVWFIFGKYTLIGAIFCVLLPFILSLLVLSFSCILGYVVAIISAKVKRKNLITIILSLAFLVAYFMLYSKSYEIIENLLLNADKVASTVKGVLYPVYHLAKGAEGDVISMLISTGIFLGITVLVCYVMSLSFIKLATTNVGATKTVYKKRQLKTASPDTALLKKEFKRFISSPIYLLNCGIGAIGILILSVLMVVFDDYVLAFIPLLNSNEVLLLLLTAGVMLMASTSYITAPSISLEGKSLWIYHSLPITAWQVFKAKIKLQVYVLIIPAVAFVTVGAIVAKAGALLCILCVLCAIAYIVLHAELGLIINLKFPNFNWRTETVPVKQGLSVMLALFGGWIITFALVGLYMLVKAYLTPTPYILITLAIILALVLLLYYLLKFKCGKIFDNL